MCKTGVYSGGLSSTISQRSITSTNATWFWQLQPFLYTKNHHILVPRLVSVLHKLPKMIGHHRSKWLELYFRLLLLESPSYRSPFWNSDIPTSQSVWKQSYTEGTNGQNNDDKVKKPTRGSHSISVNYCNIFAYFHITHNKFKAALTVLSSEWPDLCRWIIMFYPSSWSG